MELFRIRLLAGVMAISCAVMQEAAAEAPGVQGAESIVACEPYLQNPVGGGITVMWQTSVPAVGVVRYGTAPARCSTDSRTGARCTK